MECSTHSWFPEPEVVDQSCDMLNFVDKNQIFMDGFLNSIDEILGEDFLNTFEFDPSCNLNNNASPGESQTFRQQDSPEPPSSASGPPPKRKRVTADRAPCTTPVILNFGDRSTPTNAQTVPLDPDQEEAVSQVLKNECNSGHFPQEVKNGAKTANKNSRDRPQSQMYDHIISERKRRKLLSEQFLTLSGMVPGLKKMDKTSVLGATIKYMRSLQERTEMLEEKLAKETVESAVLVRKSQIMVEQEDDEGSSDDENSGCSSFKQPLPEIETKVCNNQALLKIHCEKQKGVMVKILAAVEKLNLSVVHSNVSPFGNFILDITIMVEMDKECSLTANQIVQALHSALRTTR